MQPNDDNAQVASPRGSLWVFSGVAFTVAGLLTISIVLPAEFGIDPLGTGRALGLLALADAMQGPLERQDRAHASDRVEFILEAFQSVEYKYQLEEGNSMIYAWSSSGELVYDMHADPEGLEGEEYVESFDVGTGSNAAGLYHAPFTGIHGWFWENRTFEEVILRLESAGYYTSSTVFRDGGSFEKVLEPVLE
jgi:hypothetical protein